MLGLSLPTDARDVTRCMTTLVGLWCGVTTVMTCRDYFDTEVPTVVK